MSGVHADLIIVLALVEFPVAAWFWRRVEVWWDKRPYRTGRLFGGHP